jgi:hypothetical protein
LTIVMALLRCIRGSGELDQRAGRGELDEAGTETVGSHAPKTRRRRRRTAARRLGRVSGHGEAYSEKYGWGNRGRVRRGDGDGRSQVITTTATDRQEPKRFWQSGSGSFDLRYGRYRKAIIREHIVIDKYRKTICA